MPSLRNSRAKNNNHGNNRRKRQARFPTSKSTIFQRYGPCYGAFYAKVGADGVCAFHFAGKEVRVKLRKGDAGKELFLLEYRNGIAMVDIKWNLLRFIPKGKLPRVG